MENNSGHIAERLDAEISTLKLDPCRNEKLKQLLQMAATKQGLSVQREKDLSLYKYYGRFTFRQIPEINKAILQMLDLPVASKDPMTFLVQFCIQFGKGLANLEADPATSHKISVYFGELSAVSLSRYRFPAQQALFQVTLCVNPLVFGYFRRGQEAPAKVAEKIREVLDVTDADTDFIVRAHYLFNYVAMRADKTMNFGTLAAAVLEENLARVRDAGLQEQQRKDLASQLFLQLGALVSLFKTERDWLEEKDRPSYRPDAGLFKAAFDTLAGLCQATQENLESKRTQLGFSEFQ